MSTQHTAERAAEYRTAYNEGSEARRSGRRIGENPYRYGRADLAMHWRDGWSDTDDDLSTAADRAAGRGA